VSAVRRMPARIRATLGTARMRTSNRQGFSLLEAVVAAAIVGLVSIAALGALAAELRVAGTARRALEEAALAQDRMAAMRVLPAATLRSLPDSLSRGAFPEPFARYRWEAAAREVRGEQGLVDVEVRVISDGGSHVLRTRLYRPRPRLRLDRQGDP
jgi:Tfp pilus assembly protein PilV